MGKKTIFVCRIRKEKVSSRRPGDSFIYLCRTIHTSGDYRKHNNISYKTHDDRLHATSTTTPASTVPANN